MSARFAPFVAMLGRGPGRARALTRDEAREAFAMVLAGEADPHQIGAFLMLLRYRGEDADEVAGLVEAARAACFLPAAGLPAMLDWPSYGAGRTRPVPWFLLAALALSRAGVPVLMHGSNAFGVGMSVAETLAALGLRPAESLPDAARLLAADRFAYLPLAVLSPALERLMGLRDLFGLRSPVNTVVRLLDPAGAPAGVDGVFHPPYIEVHLAAAERLGRPRLLVLKGGGGEAERNPAKPVTAHLWRLGGGRQEWLLPPWPQPGAAESEPGDPAGVWRGDIAPPRAIATICATIALGLLASGRAATAAAADAAAGEIWLARR